MFKVHLHYVAIQLSKVQIRFIKLKNTEAQKNPFRDFYCFSDLFVLIPKIV